MSKRAESGILIGLMPKPLLVLIHLGLGGRDKGRKGEREKERSWATPSVLYWDGAVEVAWAGRTDKIWVFSSTAIGQSREFSHGCHFLRTWCWERRSGLKINSGQIAQCDLCQAWRIAFYNNLDILWSVLPFSSTQASVQCQAQMGKEMAWPLWDPSVRTFQLRYQIYQQMVVHNIHSLSF